MKSSLVAVLLTLASLAFAGEAPALPQAAQSALEKATAAVQANRAAYDKANAKAFEATEKALKAELERLTKAGKLEEAMAVKKAMEGFREEIVAKVDKEAGEKKDLMGDGSGLVIISAIWGTKEKNVDVKDVLNGLIQDGKLSCVVDFKILGDPAPGEKLKTITIVYSLRGVTKTVTYNQWDTITIK